MKLSRSISTAAPGLTGPPTQSPGRSSHNRIAAAISHPSEAGFRLISPTGISFAVPADPAEAAESTDAPARPASPSSTLEMSSAETKAKLDDSFPHAYRHLCKGLYACADLNRPKIGVVSGERVLLRDDAYVSQGDVNAYGIKIEIFISSSNHKLYFDTGFKQM